ncbi:hypothetical protein ACODT4_41475 [Streptomyces sp. 2.9]
MRDFWETRRWPDGEHRAHWHLTFEERTTSTASYATTGHCSTSLRS